MKLKGFDILKEGTAVTKMNVASFCNFLQLEKALSRHNLFFTGLHTADEMGEKGYICLIANFSKLYSPSTFIQSKYKYMALF